MEPFICPRCGNKDPRYIGVRFGERYCRRCIGFHGTMAVDEPKSKKDIHLHLDYPLSKQQHALSEQVKANFIDGLNTLVYAVTGSGKTEISYGVIAYAMGRGMNVGFALPRRDVVIELFFRLKEAFPENKIVAVYGQHTSQLVGDCVILTTHQLYRYHQYFDLLVLDEIDAFPFKGDPMLHRFFEDAVRGRYVLMSATPSKEVVRVFKQPGHAILTLRTRFHRHPIPVPKAIKRPIAFQYYELIKQLKRFIQKKKRCFIFVPTVAMASSLYAFLKLFCPRGEYVSSKREKRSEIIAAFKQGKYDYLVTTAVLERGVTVKGLQVIVFHADDPIYDTAALIQIAGRAGRKISEPEGEVFFLCQKESEGIINAIKEIRFCNEFL